MMQIEQHILSLQGHPEFSIKFAKERLISRRDIIDPKTYERAKQSYGQQNDYEIMSNWIRQFALQACSKKLL